jgi:hypothetical protein
MNPIDKNTTSNLVSSLGNVWLLQLRHDMAVLSANKGFKYHLAVLGQFEYCMIK